MRLLVAYLLTIAIAHCAIWPGVQNGARHVFDGASYDIGPYRLSDTLAGYLDCYDPKITNGFISISRSGGSTAELNEGDGSAGPRLHKLALPWLGRHTNSVQSWVWLLTIDNGGYTAVVQRGHYTNTIKFPTNIFDGAAYTDPGGFGHTSGVPNFVIMGRIPGDRAGGDATAKALNDAAVQFANDFGFLTCNLWPALQYGDSNGLSGWGVDYTNGTHLAYPPYSNPDHPWAAGWLNITTEILKQTGAPTNIASAVLDWGGSVVSTSRVAITSVSRAGNTMTFVWHGDGMPSGFDVPGTVLPEGTVTNDARPAFVLIPSHGSAFQFGFAITNLPIGTYSVDQNGHEVFRGSGTQIGTFLSFYTNYVSDFWGQRCEALRLRRLMSGIDPVTLQATHGAGEAGVYGFDMINFGSNAEDRWDAAKRGDAIIGALTAWTDSIATNYMARISDAVQQTNHTFTVTCLDCPPTRIVTANRANVGRVNAP